MISPGDDLTRKAQADLNHAADAYVREAEEHEKKGREHLHLAGIEKGIADKLRKNADDTREQARNLKSH